MGLTAYFDESGTHDTSPTLILGGAVAKNIRWSRTKRELRSLFKIYGLDRFHAVDVRHRRGSFKGWSQTKLQAFFADFLKLIFKRSAYCVTVACEPDAYAEIYRSADTHRSVRKDTHYGLCFRVSLGAIIHFISDRPWTWPLDVVLESGHRNSGDAERIFQELKVHAPYGMLGQMVLKRKADCDLLAIADALTHAVFRAKTGNPGVTPALVLHDVNISEVVPRERTTFDARFQTFNLTRDSLSQIVESLMVGTRA
ncbi:hypothetical protein ACVILK_005635 [Bradyrhizobium embrapense]